MTTDAFRIPPEEELAFLRDLEKNYREAFAGHEKREAHLVELLEVAREALESSTRNGYRVPKVAAALATLMQHALVTCKKCNRVISPWAKVPGDDCWGCRGKAVPAKPEAAAGFYKGPQRELEPPEWADAMVDEIVPHFGDSSWVDRASVANIIATAIDQAKKQERAKATEPLLEILREVEWSGSDYGGETCCPSCGGGVFDDTSTFEKAGHRPDCKLAAALR